LERKKISVRKLIFLTKAKNFSSNFNKYFMDNINVNRINLFISIVLNFIPGLTAR